MFVTLSQNGFGNPVIAGGYGSSMIISNQVTSGGGGNVVTYDATTLADNTGASSLTFNHTVGSGLTDSYLVIQVAFGYDNPSPLTGTCTVDGVTANTLIGPTYPDNDNLSGVVYTFGIVGISAGSHTIVLTTTTTISSIIGIVASYQFVNQTSPIAHSNSSYGWDTNPLITIASSTGNRVSSFMATGTNILTAPATYTQGVNVSTNTGCGNATQSDTVGSSTVNLAWTVTNDYWVINAVDLAHD